MNAKLTLVYPDKSAITVDLENAERVAIESLLIRLGVNTELVTIVDVEA